MKKGGDAGVIKKIADLVQDKVMTEIADLADHSDRTGMRIQVELKREAIPQVVLNKLFKHTGLQATFGYNAVALVGGVPRTLSLLELIRHYLDYQREIVTRRSKHELRQGRGARPHPPGLPDRARQPRRGHRPDPRLRRHRTRPGKGLMEQFDLSEIQAQAILDLRLARLTGLERKRIEDEFADLQERIAELRAILRTRRRSTR